MSRRRFRVCSRPVVSLAVLTALSLATLASDEKAAPNEMRELAEQIAVLEKQGAAPEHLAELRERHRELSELLSGRGTPFNPYPAGEIYPSSAPTPPGTPATTTHFANDIPTPILSNQSNTSDILVSGVDPFLWDLDLVTNITHTFNEDLAITLTSPAGTVVVIGTHNGGPNDDVYDGTLWDDQQVTPVTDWVYMNDTTAGPLTPEGALLRVLGEDPNGIWTLDVADLQSGDTGMFTWALDVTTIGFPPNAGFAEFANTTPKVINDNQSNTSTIEVSGMPSFLCNVFLRTNILHTSNSDLDIYLTAPSGTLVIVGTDNGVTFDNVYNGTIWNDTEATPVTDWIYANNVVAGPLTPEGALARFIGEDPNGTWTLNVSDDSSSNTGSFTWSILVVVCESPVMAQCFGDGSGAPCGCGNEAAPGSGGGCANAAPMPAGQGAVLSASGTNSTAADDLVLTADFVTNQPGLFFQGDNSISGGSGATFGDGLRCCGTNVVRLEIADPPGPNGAHTTSTTAAVLGTSPPATTFSGDTRCYQYWYRNPGRSLCGATNNFNLSNSVTVTWAP